MVWEACYRGDGGLLIACKVQHPTTLHVTVLATRAKHAMTLQEALDYQSQCLRGTILSGEQCCWSPMGPFVALARFERHGSGIYQTRQHRHHDQTLQPTFPYPTPCCVCPQNLLIATLCTQAISIMYRLSLVMMFLNGLRVIAPPDRHCNHRNARTLRLSC